MLVCLCSAISVNAQTISVNGEAPPTAVSTGVAAGMTVSVSDGPGNTTDWIALYTLGAPDNAPVSWSYLSGTTNPPASGLTAATFTVYAPLMAGDFEFRLFANDGWTRIATSAIITIHASEAVFTINGAAPPTVATAPPGSTLNISVANGPGNATDFVALAPAGSPDGTILDWRYLNGATVPPAAGSTGGSAQFLAPAAVGDYEIRLFAHDSYSRVATNSFSVSDNTAALRVNDTAPPTAVSVVAGTYVTVDITGGPAQPADWVGLYAANAADSSPMLWKYLNGSTTLPASGLTNATLTFAVAVSAGSYEFRFFNADTLSRLATSTTLVVSASSAALSVNGIAAPSSVTVAAGSQIVVSVSGGPANVGDWVGLYGAGQSTLLDFRYLNDAAQLPAAGVTSATLHFGAPTAAGTYEFRFFSEGGGMPLTSSGLVVVPVTAARITVNGIAPPSSITAAPGSTLALVITDGPANPTDWIALAVSGSPDSSSVAWQYLNGSIVPPTTGLAGATLSFDLPSTAGTYELRLFAHNSLQRITTSGAILAGSEPATVSVNLMHPFPGTTFNAPSSVLLTASASITGGTIGRVDFYSGTTLIGSAAAAPYQALWPNPPQGAHSLTAVAVDSTNNLTSSAAVSIAIGPAGVTEGTLGPPVANPPGGVYGLGQIVTLSAASSTTIRYTIDGSESSETSPVYSGPLTITQLTTVRARAYQAGWERSEEFTAVYQIDTTPPVIVASISPSPNLAGWNNTPATVTFECQDDFAVTSCPPARTVTDEGAGQIINVSAEDSVGLQSNITVTLNIDSQAPVISIVSPVADLSTTDSSVQLTGTVADSSSGVSKVVCNGQWVSADGGDFFCGVSLTPGQNTVLAVAMDAAGNTASIGLAVNRLTEPTDLSIAPTSLALAVGEARVLTATTDTGLSATSLAWVSSDPAVVAIGPQNDGTITAEALGEATITAISGNLSAQATVRVLPNGVTLGDAIWTKAPTPGRMFPSLIRGNPVRDEDPDMFSIEPDATFSTFLVKALRAADGATLWTETVTDRPIADAFGGFLVKAEGGPMLHSPQFAATALRRIGRGEVKPWEYLSSAYIDKVAAAPDGTVYFAEYTATSRIPESLSYPAAGDYYNIQSSIVAVDGRTGVVKFRVPMPVSSWRHHDPRDEFGCVLVHQHVRDGGSFGPISILENGDAYVQHIERHRRTPSVCGNAGDYSDSLTLRVWRVTPQGVATSRILAQDSSDGSSAMDYFFEGVNRPDGHGGVMSSWRRLGGDVVATDEQRLTHIRADGTLVVRPALWSGDDFLGRPDIMVASPGVIYLPEGPDGEIVARDTASWEPLWPHGVPGLPIQGLMHGQVRMLTSHANTALMQDVDSSGDLVRSYPSSVVLSLNVLRDQGVLHGISPTGGIEMISVSEGAAAEFSFLSSFDSCSGKAAPRLNADAYTTRHIGLVPHRAQPYSYRFEDDLSNPADRARWRVNVKVNGIQVGDQKEGVRQAFRIWDDTSLKENLGYRFIEAAQDAIPDIRLRKASVTEGTAGNFEGGPQLPNRRITSGVVTFSIDEQLLLTQTGYMKAALHEIGHALGLAHPWAPAETKPDNYPLERSKTVMNPFTYVKPTPDRPLVNRRDDNYGNIPKVPSSCDREAVRNAIQR
jgi:hypothetical protein